MNIRYKLTTQKRTTHNGFKVPDIGIWFEAEDMQSPPKPCTNTVLHFYHHPLLAVLFNPIHADISNPILWEIEIAEELGTDGLKGWCRRQRLVRQIPLPEITTEQRIAFSIYCAEPFMDAEALKWASAWMNGKDRSVEAVRAARTGLSSWVVRTAVWAAEAVAWAPRGASFVLAARTAAAVADAEASHSDMPKKFIDYVERVMK